MRSVIVLILLLLLTGGAVLAQDVVQTTDEIWYWGIEAETASLVAYNARGQINRLDVILNPAEPHILIWRMEPAKALALIEIGDKLVLYELTSETARRVGLLPG